MLFIIKFFLVLFYIYCSLILFTSIDIKYWLIIQSVHIICIFAYFLLFIFSLEFIVIFKFTHLSHKVIDCLIFIFLWGSLDIFFIFIIRLTFFHFALGLLSLMNIPMALKGVRVTQNFATDITIKSDYNTMRVAKVLEIKQSF